MADNTPTRDDAERLIWPLDSPRVLRMHWGGRSYGKSGRQERILAALQAAYPDAQVTKETREGCLIATVRIGDWVGKFIKADSGIRNPSEMDELALAHGIRRRESEMEETVQVVDEYLELRKEVQEGRVKGAPMCRCLFGRCGIGKDSLGDAGRFGPPSATDRPHICDGIFRHQSKLHRCGVCGIIGSTTTPLKGSKAGREYQHLLDLEALKAKRAEAIRLKGLMDGEMPRVESV